MTVGYGKDLTWNDIGMPIAKPRRCLADTKKFIARSANAA
jgi:hypothetical protein